MNTNNSPIKCPCDECISLAICYNTKVIKCEILYSFLCYIDMAEEVFKRFRGYKVEAAIAILDTYGRYVRKTNYLQYSITLTSCKSRRDLLVYADL